jgi:uridine kinase
VREAMQYDSEFDMTIISLDCFYKGIDKSVVEVKDYNFDHPDALDFDLAYSVWNAACTLGAANPPRRKSCPGTKLRFPHAFPGR